MGDWAITTYWGDGPRPNPQTTSFSDQGARAARVGWVGRGGLWQLEVLQKYGRFVVDPKVDPWLVGVGPGYLREAPAAPLSAGWNYVVSERAADRRLFQATVDLLGGTCATVVEFGDRAMLCLAEVVRCAGPDADWELGDSHNDATGEARLVEALALAAEQTHAPRRPFVLGLHTASYGYLHTGQLSLSVDHPLQWRSGAERRLTGTHNELLDEEAAGPYAHSMYFDRHPVAAPATPWPYP